VSYLLKLCIVVFKIQACRVRHYSHKTSRTMFQITPPTAVSVIIVECIFIVKHLKTN